VNVSALRITSFFLSVFRSTDFNELSFPIYV